MVGFESTIRNDEMYRDFEKYQRITAMDQAEANQSNKKSQLTKTSCQLTLFML